MINTAGSSVLAGAVGSAVTVVDATYQILSTDDSVICNKASAFTVTLPVAVVGTRFRIKNIGAGTVTVEGNSKDTIDGQLNQSLSQWESMDIQCYLANTWVIE